MGMSTIVWITVRIRGGRPCELASDDVERFLYDLKADTRAAVFERMRDELAGGVAFGLVRFIEQIDEDVRVDEISAHSSRRA